MSVYNNTLYTPTKLGWIYDEFYSPLAEGNFNSLIVEGLNSSSSEAQEIVLQFPMVDHSPPPFRALSLQIWWMLSQPFISTAVTWHCV